MSENQSYILGTDKTELERLGFQHRVWSSDAARLWERGRVQRGMHILDLGAGPGFATFDLAGNRRAIWSSHGYRHFSRLRGLWKCAGDPTRL